jgi:hypothetical protein
MMCDDIYHSCNMTEFLAYNSSSESCSCELFLWNRIETSKFGRSTVSQAITSAALSDDRGGEGDCGVGLRRMKVEAEFLWPT